MKPLIDANIHDPAAEDGDPAPGKSAALAFAQTMATRLCHDLAGMLGAVTGALEMINEDATMIADAWMVASDEVALRRQPRESGAFIRRHLMLSLSRGWFAGIHTQATGPCISPW